MAPSATRTKLLLLLQLALAGCGTALLFQSPHYPQEAVGETPPKGKIFFLMLADRYIEWEDIWVSFFSSASGGGRGVTFEAFLHCQNHAACLENVQRQDLFTIIPTVESRYCGNLVSPMVALLSAAVGSAETASPGDAFAFVSGNSLPVKPLWLAQRMLTRDLAGMAIFETSADARCGAFKASQWSVLRHSHAEKLLQGAAAVARTTGFNNRIAIRPRGCGGCLDENWPIVRIFGVEALKKYPAEVPATLRVQSLMYANWSKGIPKMRLLSRHKGHEVGEELQAGENDTGLWGREEGPLGPELFTSVGADLLTRLRGDPSALFMRKVNRSTSFEGPGSLSLPKAWDEYILKDGMPQGA
uniref:Uncharacterized protein n=1 Tax=Alexandrium catenella TaxID=2925 RepID=A0A7S1WVZ6_ALECA|mmetsp:Transcript_94437/g.250870  ORF Transcript_94437/g.250870 Transcript_94437/m.250870 type:complete len:358 (+) Transcript_94437:85-1158(+)